MSHAALKRISLVLLSSLMAVHLVACEEKHAQPAPPPPEVEVIETKVTDVPISQEWVATTDGMVNAKIHAQVAGYLVKQVYKEGTNVKQGEVLFEIDDRPFKAAVDQSQGDLAQAQARLAKATMDVNRYTPLAAESAISQQELDDAVQAKAAAEAAVAAARAVVEQSQYSLGFTRVTSLIDGVAGLANAQIGDLVGPTTTELTAVSTISPIKVYFTVSEQEYLNWRTESPNAAERASQEDALSFDLILSNGTVWPHKGKFLFVDRQVDMRTGAIRLAAEFPNPDGTLRPGQFARIRTIVKVRKGIVLIPQRAVMEVQGTYQVAVVGDENKVQVKPVKLGERFGSDWIVESGLDEGETLIVEGGLKARPGTIVSPKPYAPPDAAKPKAKGKKKGGGGAGSGDKPGNGTQTEKTKTEHQGAGEKGGGH